MVVVVFGCGNYEGMIEMWSVVVVVLTVALDLPVDAVVTPCCWLCRFCLLIVKVAEGL